MKVNSESIYDTTASPFTKLTWGRCTKKTYINGATLYLHVFDWPTDGKLLLPGLRNKVEQAYLIENLKKLETSADQKGVTISLPEQPLDPVDTVVVLKVAGALDVEQVIPTQDANGQILLPIKLADIHNPGYGEHAKIEIKDGKANIGNWTDARVWVEWSFKVDRAGKFAVLAELAMAAEQTAFEITIGSSKLEAKIEGISSDDQFKKVLLGQVELSKPGTYSLQIRPIKEKWNPVKLRSMRLVEASGVKIH
jgi:alpha-L-fucosidase